MRLPEAISQALANHSVTDVLINGHQETFLVQNNDLVKVQPMFGSQNALVDFAKHAIEAGGNHLDYANPICDVVVTERAIPELAQLDVSRIRIHAALGLGIGQSDIVCIRVHRNREPELISFSRSEELATLAAGASFVVSGSPGAGKTTLLRAMLGLNPNARTVIIEDTPELMPIEGHFVGLNSRPPNSDGRGEIGIKRLLTEALRMRPDRLVIGEIRGSEVVTLLEALNLGVSQVAFTIHANQAFEVKTRLRNLWLQSGQSSADLESLLSLSKITVVHLERNRVAEIAQLG